MESQRLNSTNYIPAIDGLRAISILAVMSSHGVTCLTSVFGEGGWFGVHIFFVISGFLITRLALAELATRNQLDVGRFYIRRFLRIRPALWFLLIFYALVNPFHLAVKSNMSGIAIAALNLTDYNLALKWGHSLNSGLEFCWTLGVEMKFYLVFPFLMLLCQRFSCWVVLLVALVLMQIWRLIVLWSGADVLRLSSAFDTQCGVILVGCFAASCLPLIRRSKARISAALGHPLSSLLILALLWYWMRCIFRFSDYSDIVAVRSAWLYLPPLLVSCVALLLMSLTISFESGRSNFVGRFLSLPPMVWVGRLSYSMYLWHTIAILYTCQFFGAVGIVSDLTKILLTILIAALSYFFIERPFLAIKKLRSSSS